jgi:hypothetical protein
MVKRGSAEIKAWFEENFVGVPCLHDGQQLRFGMGMGT